MIRAVRRPRRKSRYYGWTIVWTLAITETVSWGILYYAFAVFLNPVNYCVVESRPASPCENMFRPSGTPSGSSDNVPRRCSNS